MKTALITGVTGQDGQLLSELLVGKGYRVVGTSRSAGAAPAGVERRVLDLLDLGSTAALVREVSPDELYHLAGQSSVGYSFADPVGTFHSIASSTLSLLEAVRASARPVRLFVAGSGEAFGETGQQGADESTPFRPNSPYAAAKAAAAELARVYRRSYGLFVGVGFLFNHESPRRPERFVTRKIVRGACEIALGRRSTLELGDLSVVRDFGWAPEYVEAFWKMLALDTPEDFVLGTGIPKPLAEFVELVFASLGLNASDHVRHDPSLVRPTEIAVLCANPSHAARRLGWRATTPLAEVARRMVEAEQALLG
jgi:GDPmannose 4,6-dehydratase